MGTHLSHARNVRGQTQSIDTQKRATQKTATPQNNPILPAPPRLPYPDSTWDWLVMLIHFETLGLRGYRVCELSEVHGPHSKSVETPLHRSLTPCQSLSSVLQHRREPYQDLEQSH